MQLFPKFALVLLLILFPAQLLPQTSKTEQRTAANKTSSVPPTELGRFQIVFSPYARDDTFLVDTVSGKVWHLTKLTDFVGEPSVWIYIDRIDNSKQDFDYQKNHLLKRNYFELDKSPSDGFIPD